MEKEMKERRDSYKTFCKTKNPRPTRKKKDRAYAGMRRRERTMTERVNDIKDLFEKEEKEWALIMKAQYVQDEQRDRTAS